MPKKSNKTAHVLNLLTNGGSDLSDGNESIVITNPNESIVITNPKDILKEIITESLPSAPEAVVEVEDSNTTDFLSALVKADLERELNTSRQASTNSEQATDDDVSSVSERPPYSPTFMAKFGIDSALKNSTIQEIDVVAEVNVEVEPEELPISLEQVKSEAYILEDFNDEDDEEENIPMDENTVLTQHDHENAEGTKVLHNIVEDVMKLRVPEIMKSLNMCYCTDCVFDVMALALNHMQPLYTVTEKGQLYKKLTSYETQYGTDLTSEITKACLKVKLNPNHQVHTGK